MPSTKCDSFEQYKYNIKPKDIETLLSDQRFDFASIWCKPGTICKTQLLRLDIQDPTPTHQNLQIQVNTVRSHRRGQKPESTTVANVLINFDLMGQPDITKGLHVVQELKDALLLSAETGCKHEVSSLGNPVTQRISNPRR